MKIKLSLLSLLAFCSASQVSAQSAPAAVYDSVQSRFNYVCTSNPEIKGAILKIEKVGSWADTWTFGVRDTVSNTPLNGNEKYRIGSISKTFLATAVTKLAANGGLSLSDTIGLYLPPYITAVIPHASEITIRHLLRHTSGLADPTNDTASTLTADLIANPFATWSFDTLMLHYFAPLSPTSAPSDTCYYSNTNYWLLGKIVEQVTGVTYDRYIDSVIIQPLALSHTYIPALSDSSITDTFLHGYFTLEGLPRLDACFQNVSWAYSAGSIISNVHDITTFHKALRAGSIIPTAWVDSMTNYVAPPPATGSPYQMKYGYGIYEVNNTADNIHFSGHNGELPGYGSIMYYYPQHNTYITATLGASAAQYADLLAILIDLYLDNPPSSVAEQTNSNKNITYPVPCSKDLYFGTNTQIDNAKIYTLNGGLVKEINSISNNHIDIQDLSEGNYIIILNNEAQSMPIIERISVGR